MNKASDPKIEKLSRMAEKILAEIGIKVLSETYQATLSDKGVPIRDGKAFFSPEALHGLLAKAPATFTLSAANPDFDMEIGSGPSQVAAGYGCASIMDPDGDTRDACLADHLELVKLIQASPEFNINGGILAQPSDVPALQSHLAMHYTSLVHSDKCLMGMPGNSEQMEDIMALSAIRFGGRDALKKQYRVITMVSPVSPLQVDDLLLDSVFTATRYNQPLMVSPGVSAGSTGPIDMAGNVAMAAAEALGVIAVIQTLNPGNPVIFGLQCYGSDMKSGNISIGSPAYALQARYCAALARHYNLPSRAGGTTNDAKSLSPQAGYESMLAMFTAMQNRVSLIVHSAGILDTFAAMSFEKFIMDLEMIRMVRFYLDDMAVSDETLNFDLIQEVGPGGLFLTSMDTMKKCRTHTWNPDVALRGSLGGMTPDEKFLGNIRDTRNRLLAGYEKPAIEPAIQEKLDAYMRDRGIDPAALPTTPTG